MKLKENQVWYCEQHDHIILTSFSSGKHIWVFVDLLDGAQITPTKFPYFKTDFDEMEYIGEL